MSTWTEYQAKFAALDERMEALWHFQIALDAQKLDFEIMNIPVKTEYCSDGTN